MKTLLALAVLSPILAKAETPPPASPPVESYCTSSADQVCIERKDLDLFIDLARERRCLDNTKPVFELDSVTVMQDVDGRIFYSGADPKHPYKLTMSWCHYKIEAQGKVQIVAAMKEPETWGFRFRPKAYLGLLPTKYFEGESFSSGVDAGLLVDFFYVHSLNLNVAAGFRSTGIGVGVDLTSNAGVYAGYAFGWTANPRHNLNTSLYFAF